MYFEEESEAS